MLYDEFQNPEYQDKQGRRNIGIIRGDEDQRRQQHSLNATMRLLDSVEPDVSVTEDSEGNIHTTVKAIEES